MFLEITASRFVEEAQLDSIIGVIKCRNYIEAIKILVFYENGKEMIISWSINWPEMPLEKWAEALGCG